MKNYKQRLLLLFYFILTLATVIGFGYLTQLPDSKNVFIYAIVLAVSFWTFTLKGLFNHTKPAILEYYEHKSKKRMENLQNAINALADPNMSEEDLAKYLKKGKMLLDFAEDAEKQQLRMQDRNIKASTGMLMGHNIDLE